jgi:cardiolipin synthase A/B
MGWCAHRRPLPWLGLLLLAGCQVPPARPSACQPTAASRKVLLVRQIAADTAVTSAAHPDRLVYALATGPLAYVRSWGSGLIEKRLALHVMGPPVPIGPDRPTLDPAQLEADAERISREPPAPADVRLFIDGGEALAALDAVIDGATCRLDVLMYQWNADDVGWRTARRLAAKAGPNLSVRVLIDGGGNLLHGDPREASATEVNQAVCWLAAQPHVTVIRVRDPAFRFDHRKLVVADGRVAWSGGRNLADDAFFEQHDLSYTVVGPPAATLAAAFEHAWEFHGGPEVAPLPAPEAPATPNAVLRVVRTRRYEQSLAHNLYAAVEKARHHVYVENPYFSDSHMIYLLAKARQRGADVRAVLTLHSDSPVYDHSNRVTANRLLAAGVRVYLYPGMTHVKALAVDGLWAYTGTGNFDNLSLRHNREQGLAISDGPFIGEIEERLFLPDFDPTWELTEPLPLSPLDYLYEFIAAAIA